MAFADAIQTSFHKASTEYGERITIVHGFTASYSGTDYDQRYLSSGTTVSGTIIHLPVSQTDLQQMKQGLLSSFDKKAWIHGSFAVQTEDVFNIAGSRYSVLGVEPWAVSGELIKQKVYLQLWNGSPIQYI